MDIVIFKDITTSDYLDQLKEESEKYTGLYVDMNDKEQRKYVKDKAVDINQLVKKVERKRIDESANYKIKVDAEAADISERLAIANLPFTLLIDEHKEERKKILDAENAEKAAKILSAKIEDDHEFALLINAKVDSDKKTEALRLAQEKIDSDALIAKQAAEKATLIAQQVAQKKIDDAQAAKKKAIDDKIKADAELLASQAREKLLAEQAAQEKINAGWLALETDAHEINDKIERDKFLAQQVIKNKEAADLLAKQNEVKRLADIELATKAEAFRQSEIKRLADEEKKKIEANTNHVSAVRCEIKEHIMQSCGIDNDTATNVVKALLKIKERVTINY